MFSRHPLAYPSRLPPRLAGYDKSPYYNNVERAGMDAWTENGTGDGSKPAVERKTVIALVPWDKDCSNA